MQKQSSFTPSSAILLTRPERKESNKVSPKDQFGKTNSLSIEVKFDKEDASRDYRNRENSAELESLTML